MLFKAPESLCSFFIYIYFFHLPFAVVSPTGSRPPSRNRNNEMPGDEELGFEAAVAALGKSQFMWKNTQNQPSLMSVMEDIFFLSVFQLPVLVFQV